MSGPVNFLARVNKELENYGLPPYEIINPHPQKIAMLERDDIFKLGRLDGAYFTQVTPRDFINMVAQRRGEGIASKLDFFRAFPFFTTTWTTRPMMYYLNRASREIQKKSQAIVFQSELSKRMQEHFVGKHFMDRPHKVVLNGVPLDQFYPRKRGMELEGCPAIAITASFRPGKRLHEAIRLLQAMMIKFPNAILHVFGSFDVLVQADLKQYELSRVKFHGAVPTEKLAEYYSCCDLGISLSLFDPCPNSVIEMLACGLPVVVNSASGAAEIVENDELIVGEEVTFTYMEYQTIRALPEIELNRWIEKIADVLDRRAYFSEYARERAEKALDIKKTAKAYAQLILDHV